MALKKKKRHFWEDGLCVSEAKFSVLVLTFIIIFIVSVCMFVVEGDISQNQLDLTKTIIYAIAGINIANGIKKMAGYEGEESEHENDESEVM